MSKSFFDRIKRLHDAHHRGRDTTDGPSGVYTAESVSEKGDDEIATPPPKYGGWEGLGAYRKDDHHAPMWIIETRCDADWVHGDWTLGQCHDVEYSALSEQVEGLAEGKSRDDMLFMDLETTGLGPRALVFMAGIGFWEGSEFVVQHLVIENAEDEVGLLEEFAERLSNFNMLVTFNGKGFDVPLLQKRYEHHGLNDPFGEEFHLDLLRVSRRVFPGLNRYKLTHLEQEIIHFERVDDVPGREIPPLWWKFQKNQNPSLMEKVVEHNRHDIISMVALVATVIAGECPVSREERHASKRGGYRRFSDLVSRRDKEEQKPEELAPEAPPPEGISGKLMRSYRLRGKFASRDREQAGEQTHGKRSVMPHQDSKSEEASQRVDELCQVCKTLIGQNLWRQAFPMLCEIVALVPDHRWGLKMLASYYRREGRDDLACQLENRIES